MNRIYLSHLKEWKASNNRKPLIMQGARQVGKTWLMKEFGKREFDNVAYVNFETSNRLKALFTSDFNIHRIIASIEIESNQKIIADRTLILFDEVQEADRGLTALKYFYEEAPEYFVIAAGSLLGVSKQKQHAFPVGKVDFMRVYPLSFTEFLRCLGEERLYEQLSASSYDVLTIFHEKMVQFLRLYYFIGGMPEVVAHYIENKNVAEARDIQQKILLGYENDFAKYAPNDIVPRIKIVWHAILSQLAKENRKFIYGQLKKGGRAREFDMAISWLVDSGLILKVNRISKPTIPLNAYIEMDAFKLFFVDIGLLNALGDVDSKILLEKNTLLTEFKGALTEQFVCQQLILSHQIFYWTAESGTAELDFVLQHKCKVIPIEVKAEENLKSKSLKFFVEKFNIKEGVRTSLSKYRTQDWLTNIPLYAVENIARG